MPISSYSTTAASNNSAPPNGAPEGMAPSTVNDVIRQIMADIRTQHESAEWINFGNTATYVAATQFSVTTDLTARYTVGRRVRVIATTPGTIYGTITASAFGSVTTVTVAFDGTSLSNEAITSVSVGILQPAGTLALSFLDTGLEFVSRQTPSSVASVSFTGLSSSGGVASDLYLFILRGCQPAVDNDEMWLRYENAGTAYTGGSDYMHAGVNVPASTAAVAGSGSAGQSRIIMSSAAGNAGSEAVSGIVIMQGNQVLSLGNSLNGSASLLFYCIGGRLINAGAWDGILFKFSSGNILSGDISLYRIRRT